MSDTIIQCAEFTDNISVSELASLLKIDRRKIYQLAKMQDDSLRPPGYFAGKREYRIWTSELPDYLHSQGKYADGGFARAMEVCNA